METRRDFTKRAVYVAPAILTFAVTPSMARAGSDTPEERAESAWTVTQVTYDDGGLFIVPPGTGAGSWLIYPNGHAYNFQTGKQWVYMGVFGADAVTPVSFPSLVLGANPLLLVPNL